MFRVNDRWLHPEPELEPAPPPQREVEVWHDKSLLTTTAYACERLGEAEEAGRADAARLGWERRRQNGNGRR